VSKLYFIYAKKKKRIRQGWPCFLLFCVKPPDTDTGRHFFLEKWCHDIQNVEWCNENEVRLFGL